MSLLHAHNPPLKPMPSAPEAARSLWELFGRPVRPVEAQGLSVGQRLPTGRIIGRPTRLRALAYSPRRAAVTIPGVPRTIALWVAYDGTEFHGWQDQPGLRTVQDELQQAIRRVVRHPATLVGSGRTDAGVHAASHVSSFVTTCELPVDRFRHAIVSRLADDLSIIDLRQVHPEFHATRSATSKLYRYRVHALPSRPVENFTQRYVHHVWEPLEVEQMKTAAAQFVGTLDFVAMSAKGAERETTVRTVFRCDVERSGDEIRIDVEGDGFLYKQVRTMVGTLLNVGRGRWAPDRVAAILASKDRANAGPTAPGKGLCLQWVKYPEPLLHPPDSAAQVV